MSITLAFPSKGRLKDNAIRRLTLLGAKAPISGVGFSIWLDRVQRLREARP